MSRQDRSRRARHRSAGPRFPVILGVLFYVLVAALIYSASWSTLAKDPSAAAKAEARAAIRIKYHHYSWLGLHYYERHDFRSAELAFRKSIEYGRDRPLAYTNLGSALSAQGRWDEAIAVLEHSRSLDSNLAITRNNLAWAREERAKQGR